MTTSVLNVPGISCSNCARHVTEALTPVEGVTSVNVDVSTKKVTVEYDEKVVGVDRLKVVLADEDYPVASIG